MPDAEPFYWEEEWAKPHGAAYVMEAALRQSQLLRGTPHPDFLSTKKGDGTAA
jgi:hypothetical protein